MQPKYLATVRKLKSAIMTRQYKTVKDGETIRLPNDGITPYRMSCCDCNLVHQIYSEITPAGVDLRVYRDDGETQRLRQQQQLVTDAQPTRQPMTRRQERRAKRRFEDYTRIEYHPGMTGVLQDGERLHVPVYMKDARQPVSTPASTQLSLAEVREITEARMATMQTMDAAFLDQHRPHFVDYDRTESEKARAEMIQRTCDAWRDTPAPKSAPSQEGDPCFVDGGRGYLVADRITGNLICKLRPETPPRVPPTNPSTADAAAGQALKDAAYRQMCDELVNAWKVKG
jgi:hypothetical protein